MAIDMPPQHAVEYRVERPAAASQGPMTHIAQAVAKARANAVSQQVALPPAGKMMPPLDLKSPALTQADREGLVRGSNANHRGDITKGVSAPSSYVGDRIRLATLRAKAMEESRLGHLRSEDAQSVRCRTIAVVMDRRAGPYVQGGEEAARAARQAVPREAVEQCREMMMRRRMEIVRSDPRQVAPIPSRAMEPKGVDLAAREQGRISINPQVAPRQRIDPQPAPKQRIDPHLVQRKTGISL